MYAVCLLLYKHLSITADNASSNNTMIEELAELIDNFPGEKNCVHCFNHIINLVAKSLLKLFDVPKGKQSSSGDTTIDLVEAAFQELAKDLKLEDVMTQLKSFLAKGDDGCDDNDNTVDEIREMTDAEEKAFRKSVLPVHQALVKVCVSC
jgi:hypothetical protein